MKKSVLITVLFFNAGVAMADDAALGGVVGNQRSIHAERQHRQRNLHWPM